MRHFTTSFAAALATGPRVLPLLLAAALAGCGGPSSSADTPTVPPTASPANDSVRATLTTPAPDATGTRADTATQPSTPAPQPLPKPKAALPQPAAHPVATAPAAASPAPAVAPAALPEPTAPAAPATRVQAGRVLDEAGRPLPGATVMLKGSTQGTSTDANGNYTFEVPTGENTFVVGYGGYEDETATARDGQPLNVTLVPRLDAPKSRRGRK